MAVVNRKKGSKRMAEEERNHCDVDDVVCQMEVLVHLRGLQKGIGDEQLLDKFPELVGVEEAIAPFV